MAIINSLGIDLGTTKTIVAVPKKGIVLDEPSVVATHADTGEVYAMGNDALRLVGKTAGNLEVCFPLKKGVVSDETLCRKMVAEYVRRGTEKMLLKPRVAICIPSGVTGVESRACVSAAMSVGARKVYLVEEPVAAALGAGFDIARARGVMVIDIGGGSSDIAVISLGGIVTKASVRIAGNAFDQAIAKLVYAKHRLLIGEKMAGSAKVAIGEVYAPKESITYLVKGRAVVSGLPEAAAISQNDVYEAILPLCLQIVRAAKEVLEKTPPELIGDIFETGILLTGGGACLGGLRELIAEQTGVKAVLPENSRECVALGTAAIFDCLDELRDGVEDATIYKH